MRDLAAKKGLGESCICACVVGRVGRNLLEVCNCLVGDTSLVVLPLLRIGRELDLVRTSVADSALRSSGVDKLAFGALEYEFAVKKCGFLPAVFGVRTA